MAKTSFDDAEFGEISIRYHRMARGIGFRYTPAGILTVTAPPRTPVFLLKQSINLSRTQIRRIQTNINQPVYTDGQEIGKSHRIHIRPTTATAPSLRISQRTIEVSVPDTFESKDSAVQTLIRKKVITILRKEAKAYLPRRLKLLAVRHGYMYRQVRYSHASSRWGSCSSQGTISLNIALMSLPLELIDYVLIHELCHTVEMNHSTAFWKRVEVGDPHYLLHRKQLKLYSPHV